MKNLMKILVLLLLFFCGTALADYDLTLTGIHEYETAISYSNKTILVADDAFVVYDCNLILENCTIDIDGSVECNSDITLINSVIRTKGSFKVQPGITITETGPSSIIATGDSQNAGKISLEGKLDNRITINSDYVLDDAEFIIMDADSSSNSSLKCIDFYGGWCNIQIYNKRLNEAISNCCFFGADYAVYQDSQDELTDIRFSLFYQNSTSVYLGIDGTYGADVELLVDNVIIDNQYGDQTYGLVLSGAQSISDFSSLKLTNLIITNSFCGWYIDSEWFYPPIMSNIAYYGNYYDDNLDDSSFQQNPMYLTQSPFEEPEHPNDWLYFIRPDSPVAEVSLGYDLGQSDPQQLITSLFKNSTPRTNYGIGFGMPISNSFQYIKYTKSDLDQNGKVDFPDFAIFSREWGVDSNDPNRLSIADLNKDGSVNIADLATFVGNWLATVLLETSEDANSVTIICNPIPDLNVSDYTLFLDGKYVASRDTEDNPLFIIDKMRHSKGEHLLRAVIRTKDGNSYVIACKPIQFDSPLHDLNFAELFDPSNNYIIKGELDDGYSATIMIKDADEQILWSNSYSDDFIAAVDPNTFPVGKVNYEISYSCQPSIFALFAENPFAELLLGSSSSTSGGASILALDGPPSYQTAGLVLCMLKDGMKQGVNEFDTGTARFAARMMKGREVVPIVLLGYDENNQVTYEMFKKVSTKYRAIRYMHIYAHGNYMSDGAGFLGINVPRTRLRFNDGDWPALNSRIWTDRGMPIPAGYVYLSSSLEKAHCLNHLPLAYDQLRILVIESCYALRNVATMDDNWLVHYVEGAYEYEIHNHLNAHPDYPYSDICFGLNIISSKQMILGSSNRVIKGGFYPYYATFFNIYWRSLGNGSNASDALDSAINIANIDVLTYFRTRGAGIQTEIYLKQNP